MIRYFFVLIMAGLLSACATTPNPTTAGNVSFGAYPDNYKQIVKSYLETKNMRTPLDLEKMEFINEPNKFIFSQINREKFGYRSCVLIGTQDAREFRSLRAHFFLINDGKVVEHLHDSGLVKLSDKFCNVQMLALETRAERTAEQQQVDEHGFKYIVCHDDQQEHFYAFNPENRQLIQQHDAQIVAKFNIDELSDSYIVAHGDNGVRISINRVSGTMLKQHNGQESASSCELSSKQKF